MLFASCVQLSRTLVKCQGMWSASLFNRTLVVCVQRAPLVRHCSTVSNEHPKDKVYIGDLTNQMKAVKLFSLVTSASGIIAQPFLVKQASEIGSTALVVAAYGFVGFFTFVTPVLLHLVTKQYVTELVYDTETGEYTASTISFLLRKKYLSFGPKDVQVPDVSGPFTTFTVRGVPLFVEPSNFLEVSHYGKIMGYDKPLDLKLGNISSQETKK